MQEFSPSKDSAAQRSLKLLSFFALGVSLLLLLPRRGGGVDLLLACSAMIADGAAVFLIACTIWIFHERRRFLIGYGLAFGVITAVAMILDHLEVMSFFFFRYRLGGLLLGLGMSGLFCGRLSGWLASKRWRSNLTAIAGLLVYALAPALTVLLWFSGIGLLSKIDEYLYRPRAEFRAEAWNGPNRKYRYTMLDYVAERVITPGMSREEVEAVLGKPDRTGTDGNWEYEAKRPGWRFIDFSGGGLLVEFSPEGKVNRVTNNSWVD